MTKWALVFGVVVLGAVGAYEGRSAWVPRATAAPVRTIVRPESRTVAATVTTTGVIRLRVGSEVRVGSQVSGIVRKLHVTVGSHIRRGDVIAEIDANPMEARLAQAQAQVVVAQQEVKRTEVELARAQTLFARSLVPRQQVEDLTLANQVAQAQLDKAERDVAVVETDLSYATIRAPIAGTVASVATQEGETVAAAFSAPTFVTIIADHALELIAMVDETDIGSVAVGNPVSFSVEAYPSREFTGRVLRIAPKATIVSGVVNYEVEVAVDGADEALKPDMTANVSMKTAERQALVIPSEAIGREGDERYVYVEEGGRSVKRIVTVGVRDGSATEIKRGLNPSDRVFRAAVRDAEGRD